MVVKSEMAHGGRQLQLRGTHQNAVHLRMCPLIGDGKGRSMAEIEPSVYVGRWRVS